MRFICAIHASGYSLACSTSRTVGFTSRSMNARTVSTSMISSAFICTAILTLCTLKWQHLLPWAVPTSMTLSQGAAGAHQAIIGDRLRLALDSQLTYAVTGAASALAHPALVCDVA